MLNILATFLTRAPVTWHSVDLIFKGRERNSIQVAVLPTQDKAGTVVSPKCYGNDSSLLIIELMTKTMSTLQAMAIIFALMLI